MRQDNIHSNTLCSFSVYCLFPLFRNTPLAVHANWNEGGVFSLSRTPFGIFPVFFFFFFFFTNYFFVSKVNSAEGNSKGGGGGAGLQVYVLYV